MTLPELLNLATDRHQAGRMEEALPLYQRILAEYPAETEVLNLLGLLANQTGHFDLAIQFLRQAAANDPHNAITYHQIGIATKGQGHLQDAVAHYQQALRLDPNLADAHHDLGNALADLNHYGEAIAAYQYAIKLRPNWPQAHDHLGTVFLAIGDFAQAIASHQTALALLPNDARTRCHLADALLQNGDVQTAISGYRRALADEPSNHEIHNNLGSAFIECHQLDDAIASFRRALELAPHVAAIRSNLAQALLTQGKLLEGWRMQESRWKTPGNPTGQFPPDVWDGGDLTGQTILLHAEQGFGDTIQFIRYAPLLAAKGARVIVECQSELTRLVASAPGVDHVFSRGQPTPPFNCRALFMSLPAYFGTTLESIPAKVPYLSAPQNLIQTWQQRLQHDPNRLKVGLAWAGNPKHKNDRNRSMPLALLAPLGQIPNITFYSLQKGAAADQLSNPNENFHLINHSNALTDFAESAALISHLDLVISVDTSIAHLTGALGKPIWLMLPYAADWRWLTDRNDSPWYPSMRLFRQPARGDWPGSVEQVKPALQHWNRNRTL
jgi:tetratricopeptide (TPR) repeat protein